MVLVGRVNTDVAALRAHPRIRLLGARPYDAIPGYLSAFDCCLVPFAITRLTVAVNPIKLREYLAAGRPSSRRRCRRSFSTVTSCRSPLGRTRSPAPSSRRSPAQTDETAIAKRRQRVASESWDAVAARIEPHLTALLGNS